MPEVIIGFSVAMLMTMIVWLLDRIFAPASSLVKVAYVAGYVFLSLISIGFGFGFYWKVLESRGEASRSAFELRVRFASPLPVSELRSPSHGIEVSGEGTAQAEVELNDTGARNDRDFILGYRLAGERSQHLPRAAITDLRLRRRPLLVGASRKSFLGRLLASPDGVERPVDEREHEVHERARRDHGRAQRRDGRGYPRRGAGARGAGRPGRAPAPVDSPGPTSARRATAVSKRSSKPVSPPRMIRSASPTRRRVAWLNSPSKPVVIHLQKQKPTA